MLGEDGKETGKEGINEVFVEERENVVEEYRGSGDRDIANFVFVSIRISSVVAVLVPLVHSR